LILSSSLVSSLCKASPVWVDHVEVLINQNEHVLLRVELHLLKVLLSGNYDLLLVITSSLTSSRLLKVPWLVLCLRHPQIVSLTTSPILLSTALVNDSQAGVLAIKRAPGCALLVCRRSIKCFGLPIRGSRLTSSIGLVQANLAAVVVAAFAEVEADDR
jgi:hypothetical protein